MTDTNTDQVSSPNASTFTTVKTIYARAAVVLLALNFCLTGYVVFTMNQTTQAQIDDITSQSTPTIKAVSQGRQSSGEGQTLESRGEAQVKTREK